MRQVGRRLGVLAVVVVCVLGSGSCRGAKLHGISGRVSFGGKPVPSGTVTFEPEGAGPGRGPGLVAQIKDGRYSSVPNTGHAGGPHRVRIVGFDGVSTTLDGKPGGMELPTGKLLFAPFETTVELPKTSTTRDFEAPFPAVDAG